MAGFYPTYKYAVSHAACNSPRSVSGHRRTPTCGPLMTQDQHHIEIRQLLFVFGFERALTTGTTSPGVCPTHVFITGFGSSIILANLARATACDTVSVLRLVLNHAFYRMSSDLAEVVYLCRLAKMTGLAVSRSNGRDSISIQQSLEQSTLHQKTSPTYY